MKKETVSSAKKKVWKVFSEYIRFRAADENGNAKCVSCGKVAPWRSLHAGHYIPKTSGLSIYFFEKNVHPQCVTCNLFKSGNLSEYALYLTRTYGQGILEKLDRKKCEPMKLSRGDYEELIEFYKSRVKSQKEAKEMFKDF